MSEFRVAVAGATGALGKEILAVLDQSPWRPDEVVALASASTTEPFVRYGEAQIPVDDLAEEALDGVDLVFLAVPDEAAREAGERAVSEGTLVVDCSGVFADDGDVPLVVPWVNPEALAEPPPRGVVSLPDGPTSLLAPIFGALRRAGVEGDADATVLVPASDSGRDGIDELSRQVVALFSQKTPPRKIFPDGLAFDLMPQLGPPGEDGWTERELRVVDEVRRLTGLEAPLAVTLVGVPLFSGVSAQVQIRTPRAVPSDLVERLLSDAGLQLPSAPGVRYLPRPRRVEGHPFVHIGRVRSRPDGDGLVLWASLDNLRGAGAAAVAVAGVLLKRR